MEQKIRVTLLGGYRFTGFGESDETKAQEMKKHPKKYLKKFLFSKILKNKETMFTADMFKTIRAWESKGLITRGIKVEIVK